MPTPRTGIDVSKWRAAIAAVVLTAAALTLAAPFASAQNSSVPPPIQAAPPAPPPPASRPGLFEAIGRWVDRGATNFSDHLRGAKRSMDDLGDKAAANSKEMGSQAAKIGQGAADVSKSAVDATKSAVDVTKNAMDTVAKLPTARVMTGRERCTVAPNGAPDCGAAAETLCRKNGYASGKSVDFTSAEECPAKTLVGEPAECTTVTFISRAMCQ